MYLEIRGFRALKSREEMVIMNTTIKSMPCKFFIFT
jgi:hypothetical protein